jgi:hypothetical protein
MQIEKLDDIRVEAIRYADKHCRKLKMGLIPWSPSLQQSMKRISYLQRCRLKYIRGLNISSRTLHKAWKQTDFDELFTDPEMIVKKTKRRISGL